MKKHFLILIIFAGLIGTPVFATTAPTTGLISGQIWFSQQPLVEGDTVKIYTAIWNQDTTPLQVRVQFNDQSVVLGTRDSTIPGQTLQDVSVSWSVTAGDHQISAQILSSSEIVNGRNQPVTLDHSTTDVEHVFVPVTVKTPDGTPVSDTNIVKNGIDTLTSQVSAAIPTSVPPELTSVDAFRATTLTQIQKSQAQTQSRIDALSANSVTVSATAPLGAAEKPIAYVKLFFLTILDFVFRNPIVFYSLIVVVIFFVFQYIYRFIRHR
jgi:hypothetical protein